VLTNPNPYPYPVPSPPFLWPATSILSFWVAAGLSSSGGGLAPPDPCLLLEMHGSKRARIAGVPQVPRAPTHPRCLQSEVEVECHGIKVISRAALVPFEITDASRRSVRAGSLPACSFVAAGWTDAPPLALRHEKHTHDWPQPAACAPCSHACMGHARSRPWASLASWRGSLLPVGLVSQELRLCAPHPSTQWCSHPSRALRPLRADSAVLYANARAPAPECQSLTANAWTRSEADVRAAADKGEVLPTVGQDNRLNSRFLDLRTPANQAIFKIQSGVCQVRARASG